MNDFKPGDKARIKKAGVFVTILAKKAEGVYTVMTDEGLYIFEAGEDELQPWENKKDQIDTRNAITSDLDVTETALREDISKMERRMIEDMREFKRQVFLVFAVFLAAYLGYITYFLLTR